MANQQILLIIRLKSKYNCANLIILLKIVKNK